MAPMLYTEMASILHLFRIFALGPSSSTPLKDRLQAIFSILTIFGICLLHAFYKIVQSDKSTFHGFVNKFHFSTLQLTHLIVVVDSFLRRKSELKIYAHCSRIDEHIRLKFGISPDYAERRVRFWKTFLITWTIMIVCYSSLTSMHAALIPVHSSWHLFYFCSYSIIVIRFRYDQMIFYIQLVSDRLEIVKGIMFKIYEEQRNFARNGIKQNNGSDETLTFDQMLSLKQIYGQLYEVSNLINQTFGWSLLAVMSQHFLEFTRHMYTIANIAAGHRQRSIEMTCFLMIWSLVQMASIAYINALLTFKCSACSVKVNTCGC